MSQQIATGSGMQYVPGLSSAKQIIYLDFDGESTGYNNRELGIALDVAVETSNLSAVRISEITTALNAEFDGQGVEFVLERPASGEYSTVYVGKTSSFEPYGSFSGVAETVDSGNKIKNDNAFVMLDSTADNAQIISSIAHETNHLLGTLDHGGSGLARYAKDTRYDVSSGVTSSNLTLFYDSMFVSNGGVADSTTINAGGKLTIYSGGIADHTAINVSGSMTVSSGGIADHTAINVSGSMTVSSGGVATHTAVNSNGSMWVANGGIASETTVSRGRMYVSSGSAVNTTIDAGYMEVNSSGTASNTTINGGSVCINYYATAYGVTVNSGGYLRADGVTGAIVENGGYVDGGTDRMAFVSNSFGNMTLNTSATVHSGTTATNLTVNAGGKLYVRGGQALEIKENGGYVTRESGTVTYVANTLDEYVIADYQSATAHDATVYNNAVVSGLSAYLYICGGTANTAKVTTHGSMYVDGGEANDTIINSYGYLTLYGNGTARRTQVKSNGNLRVSNGTCASSTTVYLGGNMVIEGGSAFDTELNAGGSLGVSRGGNDSRTLVKQSGVMNVYSNGIADSTTVNAGGTLLVYSAGSATNLNAQSGALLHFEINQDTRIQGAYNGSAFEIKNGAVSGYAVQSGCFLYLRTGATGSDTMVTSGGSLQLSSQGMATGITVADGGILEVVSGTSASGITAARGGILKLDVCENTWFQGTSDGSAFEMKNAYLSGYTVSSGNYLGVWRNGTVSNTLLSGGKMNVWENGKASTTTVYSGGYLYLFSGGQADNITIKGGGCMVLSSYYQDNNTILNNTTIQSGGTLTMTGGTHSGTMLIRSGAVVSASAVRIDFTVANQAMASVAIINNWSLIGGRNDSSVSYTITVNADQAKGSYVLAGGAADFNKTVTVRTTANKELGTLSVGQTATFDKMYYTLSKSDDKLILTLKSTVTTSAASDVDGNGVSDVLFQYTGNDYRTGYWMNGTNTWRSENAPHPTEWELLGAYDMDSNGKADAVYVGNVEVGGIKGAYIGYYKDGVDSDANWVNIGWLNNGSDITWKNKIGNLTGTAGKNSIVWHAAELGALGVWKDGTDDWTSLGSGYDSNWKLTGCGNFYGEGKDSVLMCYNNGEAYYTVDFDGTLAKLASANSGWEVRAIGDFAGDGIDDIIAFHAETGLVAKWENGDSDNWSKLGQLDAKDWFVVGAGEYNGDEQADLLVRQYSTGMLGYYESGDMSKWVELGRGVDMNWTVIA